MNQEKINWDDDTKNAIQGLLNNIGPNYLSFNF